ncbi:MAG: NAD-dependent epimerase/dehydratase family protein [Bdellovibrionales bacterium]|nr:NAD-dependent epimerase/dehydratase family protein [Bdellovibrionales bacterium]
MKKKTTGESTHSPEKKTLLVTGAGGALARLATKVLATKYNLIGVDPRPLSSNHHFPGDFFQIDYHHRQMTEVFRNHKIHALIHLGRIRADTRTSANFRFEMNVIGTQKLLELSRAHGVEHLVVLSTYHVYGAHRHNHSYLTEDEPLRASQTFPELADAVELDHAASTFLWRYPEVRTTILRPVNIIGKHVKNTICQMLRGGFCPQLIGYDPLMQFIDEKDMARALILALDQPIRGVFNVAGEGVLPYSKAIQLAGALPVPVPGFVGYPAVKILASLGLGFPPHLLEYFRYQTVVADDAFRKSFGFVPKVSDPISLAALKSQRNPVVEQFLQGRQRKDSDS